MTSWRRRSGAATSDVVIPAESTVRVVRRDSTTMRRRVPEAEGPPPGQLRAPYDHQVLAHGIEAALMVAPLALAVSLVVGSRPSGLDASRVPASSGWPALPPTASAQQPAPVTATRVGVVQGSSRKGSGPGSPPLARTASRSR
jgi:hypothetical protein